MNPQIRFLLFLIVALVIGCSKRGEPPRGLVVTWPGSANYSNKVRGFTISPEAAAKRVVDVGDKREMLAHDTTPIFIAGDFYVFGMPGKVDTPVSGYYVNGFTGRIEYRKSRVKIPPDATTVLEASFDSIELIRE